MKQTSIHIEPCKIQVSELHNTRKKKLDYVRERLSKNNEWWSSVSSLADGIKELRKIVKDKTGRKMQSKAVPYHEAVVVIDERTTMADLHRLAAAYKERFGITCVQIAIHRDEGRWTDGDGASTGTDPNSAVAGEIWCPNLHAHMVFDWYNHRTGKSIKTTKQDARDMQTICADILGMERGVSSDKQHMDAQRYKAHAQAAEVETLRSEIKQLSSAKATKEETVKTIQEVGSGVREVVGGVVEGIGDMLTGTKKKLQAELQTQAEKATAREKQMDELTKDYKIARSNEDALRKKADGLQDTLNDTRWKLHNTENALSSSRRNLWKVLNTYFDLTNSAAKINFANWWNGCMDMAEGKTIDREEVAYNGHSLTMRDGPVKLRWRETIEARLSEAWISLKDWCEKALTSPWCKVDGIDNAPEQGQRRGRHI